MKMKKIGSKLRDEKGAAIALVALSMVALLSAIALAVDVGMMVTTRTEAQRVSDLSALAGAGILAINPDDSVSAVTEAINFAAFNTVRGDVAVVLPGDVDVNLDSSTVTVRMVRTETRGTPVGTFFARIFGVNTVNITTTATAIAEPVGPNWGEDCLLPIMLPDRWSENGLDPNYPPSADDSFDPEGSDNPGKEDTTPDDYEATITGYNAGSVGDRIEIHKAGGGGGGLNMSWYYPWTPFDEADQLVDDGPGAATYQARFTTCLEGTYLVGDSVLTEPGAMVGPTNFGFDDLDMTDAEMEWRDPDGDGPISGCPYRPSTGACDYNTPRVRPMPMFDPTEAPDMGRKIVHVRNFGQVFVESPLPGNAFQARWLGVLAADGGDATAEGATEGLPKRLRLIK